MSEPKPDTDPRERIEVLLMSFTCTNCLKEKDEQVQTRGLVCFACHIKSVRLGFTHGKEDFHGPTVRERQVMQEKQAASAGIKAEPIGTRWV
jgi:hypothetical protein